MVKQARPSVVRIETDESSGTGVIFETPGQTGYVITNHHVVEGYGRVTVVVNDTSTYEGTVRGIDQVRDLAVVSICCGRFNALPFGDASDLEPGDEVVVIGYALGLSGEATITRGIVSAIRYDSSYGSDVIQTDAAINPGNSGGPMLSPDGEILGINTFRYDSSESGRPAEGLGFAISEKTVQARIPVLKVASASPKPTPTLQPGPETPCPSEGRFGPTDGQLLHDPSDGRFKAEFAGVSLSDMLVTATFANPYPAGLHSWDYGLIFRDSGLGEARKYLMVVVSSDARWFLQWRKDDVTHIEVIDQGSVAGLRTSQGDRNRLWLAAFGDRGLLFINREFVSVLDLSVLASSGDIGVITGAYIDSEVAGATTGFEDFEATGLAQAPELEDDWWLKCEDYLVVSEFAVPVQTSWNHGFVSLNYANDTGDAFAVSADATWLHMTEHLPDNGLVTAASGLLADSGAAILPRNLLLLAAFGERGWLFVNDVLVSELDLTNSTGGGIIGFFPDRGEDDSPVIENFNVWTP